MHAGDDGLNRETRIMVKRVRQDVASSNINGLLVEIVLEKDETRVNETGIASDFTPGVDDRRGGGQTSSNSKVYNDEYSVRRVSVSAPC